MKQASLKALSRLTRDVPFVIGWRNTAIVALSLGLMGVVVTLLLEPFATDEYDAPLRTLRLSGYILPQLAVFLGVHAIDRGVYRLQGRRWRVYNELISKPVLVFAVITANWLYNIQVINDIAPRWSYWASYVVNYGLPMLPVLLPLALLAYIYLGVRHPEPPPGARRLVTVRGRNQDEAETFPLEAFMFAEAQQNYASLYLRGEDGVISGRLIRATLSELEAQIPGAVRIHRSYLVNPVHVAGVAGNARKREIILKDTERRLPASPGFDPRTLGVQTG